MIRLPWSSPDRPLEEWAVTITSEDLGHSHSVRQLFELLGGNHEGHLIEAFDQSLFILLVVALLVDLRHNSRLFGVF